jgi:hypothetical protein
VCRALGHAREHWQDRRSAVQRLDLGLLVDAQHDRALGWVQVQPDDVSDLGDELRVLGELPDILAVRLKAERAPDAVHRRLRQADLGGHRPCRPMRRVARGALQRLGDDLLDLSVSDRPWLTRPRLVDQAIQALCGKPRAPLGHHRPADCELLRDLGVRQALGRQQHDPRALRQRLRAGAPARPRLQLLALNLAEHNLHGDRIRHTAILPTCNRINASGH